jgi:hypothetical protein
MIAIDWDARTPTASPDGFTLTLKTGVSVGLQNRLTALTLPMSVNDLPPGYLMRKRSSTMRDPFDWHNRIAVIDEARHIVKDIENLRSELVKMDRPTYDAVPECIVYSRKTARGILRAVVIWGMVLNGSVSKGRRVGDWYFIICQLHELEAVLTDVFKLESWLPDEQLQTISQPKAKPKTKKPEPDVAAQRAAIEQALKEQGMRV